MPLSRVYYTAANRPFDDVTSATMAHASMWFGFAGLLTGTLTGENGSDGAPPLSSRWSLYSSSDGHATAGLGDNINFTTFTPANWVPASAGTPHTWFVLQSPATVLDGPWYLIVSLVSANNAGWALTKTAPTGGTLTTDPTGPVQASTGIGVMAGTLTAGKNHLVVDADGNFWFWSSRNGRGWPDFLLVGSSLAEARATGDVARFVVYGNYDPSYPGAGQTLAGNGTASPLGLLSNGTAAMGGGSRMLTMYLSGTALWNIISTTNVLDGKLDAFPMPSWVFSSAQNRGRIPDIWGVGGAVPNGSVDPSTGAVKRAVMSNLLVPFGVVPSM
jgi:hypothetical protein